MGNSFSIRGTAEIFRGLYNNDPDLSRNRLVLQKAFEGGQSIVGHLANKNIPSDTNAGGGGYYLPPLGTTPPKLWDYVILQDQSLNPSSAYNAYVKSNSTLSFTEWGINRPSSYVLSNLDAIERTLAISHTSKVVIFQTWTRNPYDQDMWGELSSYDPDDTVESFDEAFAASRVMLDYNIFAAEALAAASSDPSRVLIARTGEAWDYASNGYLDQGLTNVMYNKDGYHPEDAGAYLAASVIFETITGQSVVGNPFLGTTSGTVTYAVTREQADFYQDVAHNFQAVPEPTNLLLLATFFGAVIYYKFSRKPRLS